MASPLHIQGEEGAKLRVYLLSVQNSCIPSLVYSSALGTCSDPAKGFWGTAFPQELLLEYRASTEGEERRQQVGYYRSVFSRWLGNK